MERTPVITGWQTTIGWLRWRELKNILSEAFRRFRFSAKKILMWSIIPASIGLMISHPITMNIFSYTKDLAKTAYWTQLGSMAQIWISEHPTLFMLSYILIPIFSISCYLLQTMAIMCASKPGSPIKNSILLRYTAALIAITILPKLVIPILAFISKQFSTTSSLIFDLNIRLLMIPSVSMLAVWTVIYLMKTENISKLTTRLWMSIKQIIFMWIYLIPFAIGFTFLIMPIFVAFGLVVGFTVRFIMLPIMTPTPNITLSTPNIFAIIIVIGHGIMTLLSASLIVTIIEKFKRDTAKRLTSSPPPTL